MKRLLLSLLVIGCSAPLFASEKIGSDIDPKLVPGAAAAGAAGSATASASADRKRAIEGEKLTFEQQQEIRKLEASLENKKQWNQVGTSAASAAIAVSAFGGVAFTLMKAATHKA